jgi:hypothetical protein
MKHEWGMSNNPENLRERDHLVKKNRWEANIKTDLN